MLRAAARPALASRPTLLSPPRAALPRAAPRAARRLVVLAEAAGDKPSSGGKRKKRQLAEPASALPALAEPSPASCDWPALELPGLRPQPAGPARGLGLDELLHGADSAATGALRQASATTPLGATGCLPPSGARRSGAERASAAGSVSVCTGKHCKKDGAWPRLCAAFWVARFCATRIYLVCGANATRFASLLGAGAAELLAAFRKAAPAGVSVKECKCMGKCKASPVAELRTDAGRQRHTRMHASEAAMVLLQSFRQLN